MVARAFVDVLRFGAPGGAALALALLGSISAANGDGAPTRLNEGVVVILYVVGIGGLIGAVVAYVVLLVATIVADLASQGSEARMRVVGAVTAWTTTFVMLVGFNLVRGMVPGAWVFVPPLLIAAYAAVVAWFRIPKILAR
jgi:hypothetical protein